LLNSSAGARVDAPARVISAGRRGIACKRPAPAQGTESLALFAIRRSARAAATKTPMQAWRVACISAVDGTPCLYSRQATGGLSDGINNISISSEALGTR
jgi:invasion protein IalB